MHIRHHAIDQWGPRPVAGQGVGLRPNRLTAASPQVASCLRTFDKDQYSGLMQGFMDLQLGGEGDVNLMGRKGLNHATINAIELIEKGGKTTLFGTVVEYIVITKLRNRQQPAGAKGGQWFLLN